MEYCDLESLEKYKYMNETLTEEALREITSCCLLGLVYLHLRNFSHGVFDCFTGK